MKTTKNARLSITKNENGRRFGKGVIRHNGTVQCVVWCGPLFVIVRNAKSAAAVRATASAR